MTYETTSDRVARKIREARQYRGLTMRELAWRTDPAFRTRPDDSRPGLSQSVLANIESGRPDAEGHRRRDITVDELEIIADALGVPMVMLLEGESLEWGEPEVLAAERMVEFAQRLAAEARRRRDEHRHED